MDETLQNFLDTIEARSREELEALNDRSAERNRQAAEAASKAAEAEAEVYRQSELSKIQNVGELLVQSRRTENRAALLAYRRQCQQKTVEAAKQKIADYTKTKAYVQQLKERMQQAIADMAAKDTAVTVYLRREDMHLARQLGGGKNVSFSAGDFSLGGMIVAVPAVSQRADMTFDTALRQAQDHFAEIADMQL